MPISSHAIRSNDSSNKIALPKWDVVDLRLSADSPPENPFDIPFGAVFIHENGKTLNVPGFYDGDNEFVVRASFPETGSWTFYSYSSLPELTHQTGEIQVENSEDSGKHGPVRVSEKERQHFVFADGTPYFALLFETDWLFALDSENQDDLPKTRKFIEAVKSNGFNQIIMNVFAYDVMWNKPDLMPGTDFAKPDAFPFLGSNEEPDHSALNIEFFKHLDRVIAYLGEQNIVCHLMIYVWNKKVNWPEPGSLEDDRYFDHVVKRYQAFPHMIWNISKEALLYGHEDMGYVTGRIRRIRELDAFHHLVTVHDYDYCKAYPSEVDFISIQDHSPNLYSRMMEAKRNYAEKPVLAIEHGGYEKCLHENYKGTYSDPLTSLDRCYQCVFAGCYSTHYWQHAAWNEIIYDPFGMLEPRDQPNWNGYAALTNLFKKFNFSEMNPIMMDQSTYALTNTNSVYLFYMPVGLNRVAGEADHLIGKNVKWSLLNCVTGELFEQGARTYDSQWIVYIRPEEFSTVPLVGILEVLD